MTHSEPPHTLATGVCATWPLPVDRTCGPTARSLLRSALTPLRLPAGLIDDIELMASELSANALLHGLTQGRGDGSALPLTCRPELWAYTRVRPTAQLVVTVYDPWPQWKEPKPREPEDLPEAGRGLGIVQNLSAEWGWHKTLSRLAPAPTPGKAVYFVVPATSLYTRPVVPFIPAPEAACALYDHLAARGIGGLQLSHGHGRSLVSLPCGFTVWSENPGIYRWQDPSGQYRSRPYIDLIDVAEITVQLHTERAVHPPAVQE